MSSGIVGVGPENAIYTGFWVNWTYGQLRGATLTLSHRNAGFLTAFLALFVSVAGRSFWRLFCYIMHSKLSTDSSRDGLYYQRQAILRNAATDVIGLQYFLALAWNWRNRATDRWHRILPVILFTTFITGIFYIASIFSSQISTTAGNEVLLSNAHCGTKSPPDSLIEYYRNYSPYVARTLNSASAYAQQCYNNDTLSQVCSIYTQKRLPFNINKNISCPFPGGENICLKDSMNLRLDTGLLDSHDHFGINSKPENRFQYRRTNECAVLNSDNYTQINTSEPFFSSRNSSLDFLYGGAFANHQTLLDNITYQVLRAPTQLAWNAADYQLEFVPSKLNIPFANIASSMVYFPSAPNETTFIPIQDLRLEDGVTTLIFLSGKNIQFIEPVDDDWYSAHQGPQMTPIIAESNDKYPVYSSDRIANTLACVVRRQLCDPTSSRCSPLSYEQPPSITWSSEEQEKTFNFWWAAPWILTLEVPQSLGGASLKAHSDFQSGSQGPLPADQWQQEVISWESTALAHMQRMGVEVMTGPSDISAQQYVGKDAPGVGDFCPSQKIRSTAYTCFSVLGLTITLVLGGLIIIISNVLEPVCAFLERRKNKHTYQRLEWVTNETLQLQRMVHEELNLGSWSQAASSIPVTEKDEKLGVLDISNPDHPVMVHPSPDNSLEKPDGGSQNAGNMSPNPTGVNDSPEGSQSTSTLPHSRTHSEGQHSHSGEPQSPPHSLLRTGNLDAVLPLIQDGDDSLPTDACPPNENGLQEPNRSSSSSALQLGSQIIDPTEVEDVMAAERTTLMQEGDDEVHATSRQSLREVRQ